MYRTNWRYVDWNHTQEFEKEFLKYLQEKYGTWPMNPPDLTLKELAQLRHMQDTEDN